MSAAPSIFILHASGANRDGEAAHACRLAGGAPRIVHINEWRQGGATLADADMLLLPGGFTYGDALGAGVRLALDLHLFFAEELHAFVASGKPVLGICNGFQVLVKAGLLPGGTPAAQRRRVTLTENEKGRFECRWVYLEANTQATAPFLHGLRQPIFCPIAHGEGNLQVTDPAVLSQLERENLIAFRYVNQDGSPAGGAYPANPNGSAGDIAGLCNAHGNVVGLMPHPEDHVMSIQNPLGGKGHLGLALLEAMIGSI